MRTTITIVEDDLDLNTLIQMALKSEGYEVTAFSDATEVTEMDSDLFILDINLGRGITGTDLCKQLKNPPSGQKVPVVFLISANPDLRRMAVDACADDVLPKPFSTRELIAKVAKHFPARDIVNT
jgi:DNA-binding response OmpR family regulator